MTTIMTFKVGDQGRARVCNATCHRATKEDCSCVCSGRYHGIATRRSGNPLPENTVEAEALIAKSRKEQQKLDAVLELA